jgi:hypothetical protein
VSRHHSLLSSELTKLAVHNKALFVNDVLQNQSLLDVLVPAQSLGVPDRFLFVVIIVEEPGIESLGLRHHPNSPERAVSNHWWAIELGH